MPKQRQNDPGEQVHNENKICKFKCDLFDPDTVDIDVWHLKFTSALKLSGTRDEETKRLLFINSLSTKVLETLINLCKPQTVNDFVFEELFDLLLANFKVKKIAVAERVKFFSLHQGCESLTEFANILRSKVNDCQFPIQFFQQALITAFVMGVNDHNIKSKLMEKDHNTFSEVVTLANSLFSVKDASSNFSPQNFNCNLLSQGPCFVCGGKHQKKNCHIKNPICYKCGSKNHITRACKTNNKNSNIVVDSRSTNKSGETDVNKSSINNIGGIYDVFALNGRGSHLPILSINILLNDKTVEMQFDTGSCGSIISDQTWEFIGKPKLLSSTQIFSSFTGHHVNLLGETYVQVECANTRTKLKVFVASGVKQNILGRDWIVPLLLDKLPLSELQKLRFEPNTQTLLVGDIKQKLSDLCTKFSDVFEQDNNKCSKTQGHLYLKEDALPVFKKARPVPLALRDKVKEELDRLKNNGILEEIDHSEWAAPCVVVRKPNGAIRICADFSTGLNQALKVQQFPLPTQEEILAKLGGGQKFTTLDLSDAYLSIPMDEESKKYLVINTIFGLMRYNRLCFGVAPATAIFQKQMHNMLSGLDGVAFLLDDVIITGKNDIDHITTLEEVLSRIRENGFSLNKTKCHFMEEKVNYLGLSISKEGVSTNPDKIKPIVDMPEPQNIKQLESFIGMANFYSRFIPNFADICAPLNKLRQKNVPWVWTEECSKAIHLIKKCLVSSPILVTFDNDIPVVVAADASSVGIGCAIFHRYPNGEQKPIAYASKTLSKAEQNYSQIEREALSLIYAIKKFRIYLWGSHFTIQTDHRPLLSIFGSAKGVPITTSSRLQRWALFLSNYTFNIEYISTKQFGKVDCLSRLPLEEDDDFDRTDSGYSTVVALIFSDNLESLPVTAKEISEETSNDNTLSEIKKYVLNGWPKQINTTEMKPYQSKKNELTIHEGCLMWGIRAIIPNNLRRKLLLNLHDTHMGIVKMKALARERFWWPSIDSDIENIARTCELCNRFAPREPQKRFLCEWPKCNGPWDRIHLDYAGPFLNSYFLLAVDAYSGWLEIVKLNSMTAAVTVKQIKLMICRYGIPKTIVTDNGPCFTSLEFTEFCKRFGIDHITTPAYHPSSNGQVEKYVNTMKQTLRKLCHEVSPKGIEADLNNFLFKYRLSPHITSGMSPAELFLGRQLRCTLDLVRPQKTKDCEADDRRNLNVTKHFKINDAVLWAQHKDGHVLWKTGRILKRLGRNVWKVECDGRSFKKHADQLKHRHSEQREEGDSSSEER